MIRIQITVSEENYSRLFAAYISNEWSFSAFEEILTKVVKFQTAVFEPVEIIWNKYVRSNNTPDLKVEVECIGSQYEAFHHRHIVRSFEGCIKDSNIKTFLKPTSGELATVQVTAENGPKTYGSFLI